MEARSRTLFGGGWLWAALVPALYIVAPTRSTSPSPPPAQAESGDAPAEGAWRPKTALTLLEEYVGHPLATPAARGKSPRVRTMIVDLPDPSDAPNLDWRYDAGIMSVRRAAETDGLVVDRFWLPWITASDAKRYRASDLAMRHGKPGVMLFRSINQAVDADLLQIVFVIGETPNGGVNKQALADAIAQIDSLHCLGLAKNDTLRMIAPYFTGAAHSLRLAMAARTLPPWVTHVRMITGSATQERIKDEWSDWKKPRVTVEATVNSDGDLMSVLSEIVIDRMHFDTSEVAILRESSTEYGQKGRSSSDPRAAPNRSETPPAATGPFTTETHAADFTTIPFPMHIASLRDQEEAASSQAATSETGSRAPFPISLREPGGNVDRPPSFSTLTPAAVSLAVEEIAHTLSAGHFRAVGIVATDVRDKLFLAREVRRRLPDVQLFTTESNLLYLWPDYNEALRGMLVATSYPLDVEMQSWLQPRNEQRLLAFTEEAAEGIFNAMLLHLGASSEQLADYRLLGDTSSEHRPPIWLMAIGRETFVPLYAALPPDSMRYVARVPTATGNRSVTLAGEPASAVQQNRAGGRDAPPDSQAGILVTIVLALAGMLLIAGRAVELSRSRNEYVMLERLRDSKKALFKEMRDHVVSRSLLLHQQLYTMLRDLTLGAGLVVVATMLLETARADEPSRVVSLEIMRDALLGVAVVVVAISVKWVIRTSLQALEYSHEYAVSRDWATELRWRSDRRKGDPPHAVPPGQPDRRSGVVDRRRRSARARQGLWFIEIIVRTGVVIVAALFTMLVVQLMRTALTPTASGTNLASRLFFFRSLHLASGVSPIFCVLVAVVGFALWATWHLSRIDLLRNPVALHAFGDVVADSLDREDRLARRLARSILETRERLFLVVPDGFGLVIFMVILLVGTALYAQFDTTLESITLGPAISSEGVFGRVMNLMFRGKNAFDLLLAFGVISALGSIAWGVYRFWAVWSSLKRLLDDLSASPLLPAFERIPQRVSNLSQLTLRQMGVREAVRGVSATQWSHLLAIYPAALRTAPQAIQTPMTEFMRHGPPADRADRPFDTGSDERKAAIELEIHREARERRRQDVVPHGWKARLARIAGLGGMPAEWTQRRTAIESAKTKRERDVGRWLVYLFRAIDECWRNEPNDDQVKKAVAAIAAHSAERGESSTSGSLRRLISDETRLWMRTAEETLAVQIVAYIEWVLEHLRALALFLLVSVLLATALLSSYPFQPQSGIKLLFIMLLLATVASILTVGTQMNRDEVISRVTRSDPGKVNWNTGYVFNILVFGVLPVVTYVGSGVQPIREGLLRWLEPLARVLTQH